MTHTQFLFPDRMVAFPTNGVRHSTLLLPVACSSRREAPGASPGITPMIPQLALGAS